MVSVGRSIDGSVSYVSPPSLVRWTGRLCIVDGPMEYTIQLL